MSQRRLTKNTQTIRTREIQALIGQGYTNQQIADKLIISIKYVKNLTSELLDEHHAKNRTELALLAHNIIPASLVERIQKGR